MSNGSGMSNASSSTVKNGTYTVRCVCSNCGYRGSLSVPMGTPAPSHELGGHATECPHCGCREYGKDFR